MTNPLSSGPSPLISHSELMEILEVLFCHGLQNNLPSLTSKIADTYPQILTDSASSPHRQLVVFSGFFSKFLRVGPLPYVCNYKFLNTLHNGIIGMVRHNRQVLHPMPNSEIIKLVSGVRLMLGRALLLEQKFVVKDIETFILKYLPVLPVTAESVKSWKSLGEIFNFDLNQLNNQTMKILSDKNTCSVKYMKEKLINLHRERTRSTTDLESSFLKLWRSLEDTLMNFMKRIEFCLKRSVLENLTNNNNVKLRLLTRGLPSSPSEKDLLALLVHLENVFVESQFWSSDLVRSAIGSSAV